MECSKPPATFALQLAAGCDAFVIPQVGKERVRACRKETVTPLFSVLVF